MASKELAVLLLCTTPTTTEARRIGRDLVKHRLAACVSLVPKVQSYFRWGGRVDQAKETLLFIKTTRQKSKAAISFVRKRHSYSVPELIALNITAGDAPYIKWLKESCRG